MTDADVHFPFPDSCDAGPPAEFADHAAEPLIPVCLPNGTSAALVGGYEELRHLLTDDRLSRARAAAHGMTARSSESLALNSVDPPDHTRRRHSVAAAFTSRRAEAERSWIRRTACDLVAGMVSRGAGADLIEEFSLPLAVAVICRVMGVPVADLPRFRPLVQVMMSTAGHSAEAVRAAHTQMFDYFTELYDAALASGETAGTVLGDLVVAAERDGVLSRAEAIHVAYGLLMAGYETTSNQTAICVHLLLADRSRWDRLCADPGALRPAIEEMLRWTSLIATGGVPHLALEDLVLGECEVSEGQVVVPVFAAANRDPRAFADPDRLRLDRDGPTHLAFGHGRHMCLGAALARVELEEAVGALLVMLPALELAVAESELRWRRDTFIRGLTELPVRWRTQTDHRPESTGQESDR
jgi:cytochrome P450